MRRVSRSWQKGRSGVGALPPRIKTKHSLRHRVCFLGFKMCRLLMESLCLTKTKEQLEKMYTEKHVRIASEGLKLERCHVLI